MTWPAARVSNYRGAKGGQCYKATEEAHTLPGSHRGLLALTGAAVIWGSIGVTVHLLQDVGISSSAIAFWRFVCACVVLVPILGVAQLRVIAQQLHRPGRLFVVSVSSLAFQLLYFFSVRDVGAGVATLVTLGRCPIVLHVTEAVTARSAPPPRTLVVLGLALVGLALVTTGKVGAEVAPRPLVGVIEAAGSGLAFAVNTLWSRPRLTRLKPLPITFVTSAAGILLLLPVVAVTGCQVPRTAGTLAGIAWLGVVTTVVAYGLFYSGLRSTAGSTAMIVTLLEPVTAFVLAALLLTEPATASNVAGGALLLAAVAALYLRPRTSTDT